MSTGLFSEEEDDYLLDETKYKQMSDVLVSGGCPCIAKPLRGGSYYYPISMEDAQEELVRISRQASTKKGGKEKKKNTI